MRGRWSDQANVMGERLKAQGAWLKAMNKGGKSTFDSCWLYLPPESNILAVYFEPLMHSRLSNLTSRLI
jgi:hypothetical protein